MNGVGPYVVQHIDTHLFDTNDFHFRNIMLDWNKIYEDYKTMYEEMMIGGIN